MDSELRKRLEEAAEEYGKGYKTSLALEAGFMKGAEFGYKEAIEKAKEWLKQRPMLDSLDLVEFEMYMNKPWEDKK